MGERFGKGKGLMVVIATAITDMLVPSACSQSAAANS